MSDAIPQKDDHNDHDDHIDQLSDMIRGLLREVESPEKKRPDFQIAEAPPQRDWIAIISLLLTIAGTCIGAYVFFRVAIAEHSIHIENAKGGIIKHTIDTDKDFTDTNAKIIALDEAIAKRFTDLKTEITKADTTIQSQLDKVSGEVRIVSDKLILQDERIKNLRGEK